MILIFGAFIAFLTALAYLKNQNDILIDESTQEKTLFESLLVVLIESEVDFSVVKLSSFILLIYLINLLGIKIIHHFTLKEDETSDKL